MRKYLRYLEVRPSGWLLLSVLYFFADFDEFLIIVLCVAIHEYGHLFVLDRFGIPVRRITLQYTGLTIWYNDYLLYGICEFAAALAGPIFGLIAAIVSSCVAKKMQLEQLFLFAGCNAVLSGFNLLPAKPLDGWRCLHALFPVAAQVISVCTAITVMFIGLWVMYEGYGTALAIMGIVLLLQESSVNTTKRVKFGAY